ncbi:protein brambleberry-like isoform X2 [Eriocheir sinensis]|uniref:protein brambleberry-like isoform X2 n=1 Tax=Eriocheir sinensis TaxID=95602 RepID=UPI0021C8E6A0|nr:protein brambleberry-like isoform X2 [Eriocheir sinensis]
MRLLGVVTVVLVVGVCHGGILSWLFKKKNTGEAADQQQKGVPAAPSSNGDAGGSMENNEGAVAVKIPFEIKSSDEKFLKAATELGAIKESVLDMCHHKVILGLQKSCAQLNEEDLSKVSVNLLNCQSAVENRAVFPCTSDMSLSDCTKNMDSNTWNAYHIISNRARAVCYASRQEQFGAKTQMAVNVLMHTAEEQIKSMNDLQQGQRALGDATSETLESLNQGHEHLRKQQQQLSTAHQHVHSYISLNLRELSREKKLIASGQRELALITESIKRKIEEAKKQLMNQEDNQRASHELILQDLSRIQDNALQIWQKLDASTQNILQAHEETVQQYGRLTEDMQRMNSTVHHLMDVLQTTKQGVEEKLSWITSLVGGTDNTIQKVYSCILHAGYFFVGMVSASFLQVPYFTRVALVVLVPLNALSEIRHDTCLQFSTLTTVMALCIIGNLIFSWLWSIFRRRKKSEFLQNGVLHQSLCCSFTEATHVSPMTHLPGKPLERTEELIDHSTKGSLNSSLSDSIPLACDFSSDEEPAPLTPPSFSVLRKRIFGSLSSKGSGNGGLLDAHKEEDSNEDSEPGSLTAERNKDLETSAKTLSNVRRHLLSHMNTYQPKSFLPNISLDSRDMATSSPMRDSVLDQSLSSRSLTPRKLCASVCKNGQLCRNTAVGDNLYCHRHIGGGSRESTPFSRRGSRRTTPLRS